MSTVSFAAAEERVEATAARRKRPEEQLEKAEEKVAELRVELERTRRDEVATTPDAAEARLAMVTRLVLKARAADDGAKRELAKSLDGEGPTG